MTNWRASIHEGGHAVSAIVLGLPIESATTSAVRFLDFGKQECCDLATMFYAGGAAETMIFGGAPLLDSVDRKHAEVLCLPLNFANGSPEHLRHIALCQIRAAALVTLRRSEIEHIAGVLQKKGRLDRRDFEQLTKRWHQ